MRSGLALEPDRTGARSSSDPTNLAARSKEIPYDYVARFILEGIPGRRQQDVINISIEGAFVATAIGYGFLPKSTEAPTGIGFTSTGTSPGPILLAPAPGATPSLGTPAQLRDLVAELAASLMGERLKSLAAMQIDTNDARGQLSDVVGCLLRKFCGIEFKYSIVDSGTGRELQNHPIYNIAGLGDAEGNRPFRAFPRPMTFLPRSTIRIEIEEISQGALFSGGELQIVLHGYKLLGVGA